MARCQNCGTELPANARFCTRCGAVQARQQSAEQPPLLFSPFAPPPALQPAGAGAAGRAQPAVNTPLPLWQVAVAVGAILLFLSLIIIIGQGWTGSGRRPQPAQTNPTQLPVVGTAGDLIMVGDTALGVAFTDTTQQMDGRVPVHGEFYVVGVVISNRGAQPVALSLSSLGLLDRGNDQRYPPILTAWGTPDQLKAGHYTPQYSLPSHEAVAGLVVFDVPRNLGTPHLLVRDLTKTSGNFTGTIDLSKQGQR
ncbi:MAG TPA: zinc ribbon domain-containing protein [Armatimonadota bacterium]